MLKVEAESSIPFYSLILHLFPSLPSASVLLEVAFLWFNVFRLLMFSRSVTKLPFITPLLCRAGDGNKKKKRARVGCGAVSESRPGELGDPIRAAGEGGNVGSERLSGVWSDCVVIG